MGRTFQGMGRVTNSNTLREVVSVHSSDGVGSNRPGGGGRFSTIGPSLVLLLSCISPTGSEAKSNRTVKGPEAIKSLFQMNTRDQCGDSIVRGNVAVATETRSMQEYCSWKFRMKQAGKGEVLEPLVFALYLENLWIVNHLREICTSGSNGRACRVTGIPTHL